MEAPLEQWSQSKVKGRPAKRHFATARTKVSVQMPERLISGLLGVEGLGLS